MLRWWSPEDLLPADTVLSEVDQVPGLVHCPEQDRVLRGAQDSGSGGYRQAARQATNTTFTLRL
jgi:hypothetical protein